MTLSCIGTNLPSPLIHSFPLHEYRITLLYVQKKEYCCMCVFDFLILINDPEHVLPSRAPQATREAPPTPPNSPPSRPPPAAVAALPVVAAAVASSGGSHKVFHLHLLSSSTLPILTSPSTSTPVVTTKADGGDWSDLGLCESDLPSTYYLCLAPSSFGGPGPTQRWSASGHWRADAIVALRRLGWVLAGWIHALDLGHGQPPPPPSAVATDVVLCSIGRGACFLFERLLVVGLCDGRPPLQCWRPGRRQSAGMAID